MAAAGQASTRFDSSAGELSSPPSDPLSAPGSPSRQAKRRFKTAGQAYKPEMDEIVVGSDKQPQSSQTLYQPFPQPASSSQPTTGRAQAQKRYSMIDGEWVQVTAAGLPRKKPGRKPGTTMKPRQPAGTAATAATAATAEALDQTKARKPRKSRDNSTPPIQRKRKLAPASDVDTDVPSPRPLAPAAGSGVPSPSPSLQPPQQPPQQSHIADSFSAYRPQPLTHSLSEQRHSPKIPKREGYPSSMQSILNADDPPDHPASVGSSSRNVHGSANPNTTIPVRTSGQSYDPIRGNYDPVRETMNSHNHYSSTSGSPRAPPQAQPLHRSPSIASMIEPTLPVKSSPSHTPHAYPSVPATQSRLRAPEAPAAPASPSYAPKPTLASQTPLKPPAPEPRRDAPIPTPPAPRPIVNQANFTTIANGPVKRVSPKQKPATGISTPRTDNLEDAPHENDERSILDFGKARPGEEKEAPTIVLSIPLTLGETNKYVNFMRMAEDQYGWDALHPRLAANRDRKARIAAAAASLEKTESGRESGDEMSVDLSDGDASNLDNGGASGFDVTVKPKKKRNFKEDQYDVDDDFVDDSEMLWEAQAAASRDGFFVYSGPLVPEVEKPPAGHDGPPKRGRGGRGSRGGGRGGAARGAGGTGRGGGPGSRGGAVTRKPRITKSEKAQREREKAERENLAKAANGYSLQPPTPSFSVQELGA